MTDVPKAAPGGLLVLMLVTLLWASALSIGFGYAALAGRSSAPQRLLYGGLAVFTALLAARTGYELARKLRRRA